MKRWLLVTGFLIILYSMYYDLTIGTLPQKEASAPDKPYISSEHTYEKKVAQPVIVQPGQTVLSIVEQLHEQTLSASISDIVHDFKQLNDGIEPEQIQIGRTYYFPLYD